MSPTLPALRELIRQQPHALAPKTIYADLLIERGDPRGAFIRAQEEGQHTEAATLLERYRGHFMHPLPARADVDWVNGFIDAWRTTPQEFQSAGRRLLRIWPLRSLTVSGARDVDVRYVLGSFAIEHVEEVSFVGLRDQALVALSQLELPALKRLHVSGAMLAWVLPALADSPLGRRIRGVARPLREDPYMQKIELRFEAQQPQSSTSTVT